MISLHLVEDRQCGGCTECCTVVGVVELGKPYQCKCHYQFSGGCGIYEQRPKGCKDFVCLWLSLDLPEELRPDRSGWLLGIDYDTVDAGKWWLEFYETRPHSVEETQQARLFADELYAVMQNRNVVGYRVYGYNASIPVTYEIAPEYDTIPVHRGKKNYLMGDGPCALYVGPI